MKMIPEEEPIKVVPLQDEVCKTEPLTEPHVFEDYKNDRKRRMRDAGNFCYRVALETPYCMPRTMGEKKVTTIPYNSLNNIWMKAASTRQQVFDWARSIGIVEDLLLEVTRMALEGEEARNRRSWDQVENIDFQTLQMMEEIELMDLQTRAILKLIPQKYWPRMLKAPPGVECVWEIGAYPRDRFKYLKLPSLVDKQLTQLAKYSITVMRGLEPQIPPIDMRRGKFERTEVVDSSVNEDQDMNDTERQCNKQNQSPKNKKILVPEDNEACDSGREIAANEPLDEDDVSTSKRKDRFASYQIAPQGHKKRGLKETQDKNEDGDQEKVHENAVEREDLERHFETMRRPKTPWREVADRKQPENFFTSGTASRTTPREPANEAVQNYGNEKGAHLTFLSTSVRGNTFDIREGIRRTKAAAARISGSIEGQAGERAHQFQGEMVAPQRCPEESTREYRQRDKVKQLKREIKSVLGRRDQELHQKAMIEEQEQKKEELQQRINRQRALGAKEDQQKQSCQQLGTLYKSTTKLASKMACERADLEKRIDDRLKELSIRDVDDEEYRKELMEIKKMQKKQKNKQNHQGQLLQSAYGLERYRGDYGKTEEMNWVMMEYVIKYEKNYELTTDDIYRILKIMDEEEKVCKEADTKHSQIQGARISKRQLEKEKRLVEVARQGKSNESESVNHAANEKRRGEEVSNASLEKHMQAIREAEESYGRCKRQEENQRVIDWLYNQEVHRNRESRRIQNQALENERAAFPEPMLKRKTSTSHKSTISVVS